MTGLGRELSSSQGAANDRNQPEAVIKPDRCHRPVE